MTKLLAIPALALGLTSCLTTSSENPLDNPSGTTVDPTPYLGQWELTKVLGESAGSQTLITVTQAVQGILVISTPQPGITNTQTLRLTSITNLTVASLEDATNSWTIVAVSLVNANTNLVVSAPDWNVITNDIKNGVIAGEIDKVDSLRVIARLKASGASLSSYFGSNTNLFSGELLRLEKR